MDEVVDLLGGTVGGGGGGDERLELAEAVLLGEELEGEGVIDDVDADVVLVLR